MDKNGPSWRIFAKLKMAVKQCYQTGHFVIGPKIGRKGQNWIMKCDILSNFQTLWSNRIMGERVIKFWQKWKSISIVLMGATMYYNQIDNQCIYRSHSVYGSPPFFLGLTVIHIDHPKNFWGLAKDWKWHVDFDGLRVRFFIATISTFSKLIQL